MAPDPVGEKTLKGTINAQLERHGIDGSKEINYQAIREIMKTQLKMASTHIGHRRATSRDFDELYRGSKSFSHTVRARAIKHFFIAHRDLLPLWVSPDLAEETVAGCMDTVRSNSANTKKTVEQTLKKNRPDDGPGPAEPPLPADRPFWGKTAPEDEPTWMRRLFSTRNAATDTGATAVTVQVWFYDSDGHLYTAGVVTLDILSADIPEITYDGLQDLIDEQNDGLLPLLEDGRGSWCVLGWYPSGSVRTITSTKQVWEFLASLSPVTPGRAWAVPKRREMISAILTDINHGHPDKAIDLIGAATRELSISAPPDVRPSIEDRLTDPGTSTKRTREPSAGSPGHDEPSSYRIGKRPRQAHPEHRQL